MFMSWHEVYVLDGIAEVIHDNSALRAVGKEAGILLVLPRVH